MANQRFLRTAARLSFAILGSVRSRALFGSKLVVLAQRGREFYVDSELEKNHLVDFRAIPTHMTRNELSSLYELVGSCARGAEILEIGSYYGASTCYVGTAVKQIAGTLICVDTWGNETMPEGSKDTYDVFTKNTAPLSSVISVRRKPSEELSKADLPDKLDMVFIDGDHSYKSVKTDVNTVTSLVIDNGILAFHDIKWFQGVSRVVGELLSTGEWRFEGSVDNLMWLRKSKPNYSEI